MNKSMFARVLAVVGLWLCLALSAIATVPVITVQGNQVLFGGQAGTVAGPSLFWSNNGWGGEKFYNYGAVETVKNDWNAKLIRAAMGVDEAGGYLQDATSNLSRVRAVVDAAIANDMYVIIDWHTHHGENYVQQAKSFFQQMAQEYGHHNNVIYEIYNEPLAVSWSGTLKPYAQEVIGAIRAVDPDNLIIVGTPNWSQDVDAAANDPITGFNNIAYTLHFYSGTHKQYLRDKAQYALNRGIALFATEWGTVNANGDGAVDYNETNAWMDFLKNNNISHANWALNDKSEGSSALVPGASPTGNWSNGDLTASGTFVRDIVRGWPAIGSDPVDPSCTTVAVPGKVEAENYCDMLGIQTEPTNDAGGGRNIGWTDTNDWASYNINVSATGTYEIRYRVAALESAGLIQIEAGDGTVLGNIQLPVTGGWQVWNTVSQKIELNAGPQTIILRVMNGGWNLNWFDIQPADTDPTGPVDPVVITTVEAENYSYMSGIQIESTSDVGGGMNVGWLDVGDWLSYVNTPVSIPETGTYLIEFRVASESTGGSLRLEQAGGAVVYGDISFPATGGWQQWITVSHQVHLDAGSYPFGIAATSGGWNVNWFRISKID